MQAFLSYARPDLPRAQLLRQSLELIGWRVWMDLETGGGQPWWTAILAQIRDCDLFVAVLSPAGLESPACNRERQYAEDLGKPVLPVQVAAVQMDILPPALGSVSIVDFTDLATHLTGIRLTLAVTGMPRPVPLPDPLPPEPKIPLSYLADLSERIRGPELTRHEQMIIVFELREALSRPADHANAMTLARAFADREDLYARVSHQLAELLAADVKTPAPPENASHVLTGRILSGHTGSVIKVEFNPEGTLLATASSDHTARLWDPATGRLVRTLSGHTASVPGVAFHPDGSLLATASNDTSARLWDPTTGTMLRILTGHTDFLWDVAFSPDGRLLATASSDQTAQLWDPDTGGHLRTLAGHTRDVIRVAFSPDGTLLATASNDQTARLWDVGTGRHLRTLTGHAASVAGVAFNPDGTRLATVGMDSNARLWDPATGEVVRSFAVGGPGGGGVVFSPDGTLLATAHGDKTARLWDVVTGRQVGTLVGHDSGVFGVAFNHDGSVLATAGKDKTARLWP